MRVCLGKRAWYMFALRRGFREYVPQEEGYVFGSLEKRAWAYVPQKEGVVRVCLEKRAVFLGAL